MTIGFFFLAFDESAKIHEGIDKKIHRVFGIKETWITDRIDDLIVGVYGLLGIAILYYYRKELKRYKSTSLFFIIGFILLFFMVFLDALTNRNDIIFALTKNYSITNTLITWLCVAEEYFKLMSEGMFVAGLYGCYEIADKQKKVSF